MNIFKILLISAMLLLFTVVSGLAGCIGQGKDNSKSVIEVYRAPTAELPGSKNSNPDQPTSKSTGQAPAGSQTHPPLLARPELGVPAAEAETPDKNEKMVFLTFDDGPNSNYTGKILDILAEKQVKATFMVVGRNVILNPDVLQRILAEGHGIVNHTFSHDYKIIYSSPDKFLADLEENCRVLEQYTGKPVKIFRAPGGPGKLTREYTNKLKNSGYISVGWNVTSVDSDPHGITQSQVYDNIAAGLERVENMKLTPIILMHDGTQLSTTEAKPGTALSAYIQNREAVVGALPGVIDYLKLKGYTFGVVDENTPPAWQAK